MLWFSIAKRLADAYMARETAKTDGDRIAADVQIKALETKLASRDNPALQWACGIVAVAMAVHIALVVMVSCLPWLGWTIHALPAPMNEWQGSIILSMFGVAAVGKFFR
jgi:hypothetical protein